MSKVLGEQQIMDDMWTALEMQKEFSRQDSGGAEGGGRM